MARILIVDDEPDAIELLREFLMGKNYEVSRPRMARRPCGRSGPSGRT